MKINLQKLITLASAALSTAETTSNEVIALAEHVRTLAYDAGEWLAEHEAQHQANVTRLTGSPSDPLPLPDSATLVDSGTAPLPQVASAAPPVDNDHVAEGCAPFETMPSVNESAHTPAPSTSEEPKA